jgi:uncharacterized membrane protein YsdA (DUF1294 family)
MTLETTVMVYLAVISLLAIGIALFDKRAAALLIGW